MFVPVHEVTNYLDEHHYLGRARRGIAWRDDHGVIVIGPPTSRRLPRDWLEISRWCIEPGRPNAGSAQYAAMRREITSSTVISYSDPSVGHTGALYRACGFGWAPTWHRLRTPPTGNGQWTQGCAQSVKDRWVDPITVDPRRAELLAVNDASIMRRMPWASWREPVVSCGRVRRGTAGGDYQRWSVLTR